jgi:hypothetical protein
MRVCIFSLVILVIMDCKNARWKGDIWVCRQNEQKEWEPLPAEPAEAPAGRAGGYH